MPIPVRRTKLKLHNKVAALVQLGKHLGLFNPPPNRDFIDPAKTFVDEMSDTVLRPVELPPPAKPKQNGVDG